nr:MAG TPA: hypothetical protein [Caudoviricetes sp.]
MLIKKLIQRLLDSRTTPSEAAHNASSIYTEPTWFNGTPTVGDSWTDNLYTGTAPSDGYLNVSGSANINTANAGSMIQAKISGAQISQVTPMSGQGFNMMAPISKGATFSVNGIRLADITVRFFKSIGGYNRFVRRALPCLRPSFNYLPKVFLRASILTLLTNVGRVQQYRTKTFREEVNKKSLPHLVVGPCFRLEGIIPTTISGSDLKTPQERFAISLTPLVGGNGPRSRFRRVTQSLRILASTRVRGPLLLFATNRLNNLQTGGALC